MSKIARSAASFSNLTTALLIFLIPTPILFQNIGIEVPLSFFLLSFTTSFFLLREFIRGNNNAIIYSTLIFTILFFLIAPQLQLTKNPHIMVNTAPVSVTSAVYANVLITIFILFLITSCDFFSKKIPETKSTQNLIHEKYPILTLTLLSISIAIYAIYDTNTSPLTEIDSQGLTYTALKHKIIYFIPFVTLALVILSKTPPRRKLFLFLILFICVLATKNHLNERRNAIGPVYLTLLILIFPQIINEGKRFFFFLFAIMIAVFPASTLLTHKHSDSNEIDLSSLIFTIRDHFTQLHYDAWANIVTTIEITRAHGFSLGEQVSGSIFFFIPRALWESKPHPTGLVIGDYLSINHRMWFNNLSSPIISEGYIDFGFLGVILFAVGGGYLCAKAKKIANSGRSTHIILYTYTSFFAFFILRGALLPATVYFFGALVAIYAIPKILKRLP